MWSGRRLTRKQRTSGPDHLWPELWKSLGKNAKLKEKQKWSEAKRFISKTIENCVEFISSTPRIRSTKKPSRTRVRSWKHLWLLLCPAKLQRIVGVVDPTKLQQDLRVFWKPVNLRDCVWEIHYQNIMRTRLKEKGENSLQHYNLVHKFIPMPQAIKIPAAKAAVDKE